MKYIILILPILFCGCSLLSADPELAVEAEELVVEVTKDIIKKETK